MVLNFLEGRVLILAAKEIGLKFGKMGGISSAPQVSIYEMRCHFQKVTARNIKSRLHSLF